MTHPKEAVEAVARDLQRGASYDMGNAIIRATALLDRIAPLYREQAARVAENEGVYPELNVYNGGPDWFKHGKRIAAAIRKGE